jgi:squalene-hopene/tetraprenyl-beta-curcumene cyclase
MLKNIHLTGFAMIRTMIRTHFRFFSVVLYLIFLTGITRAADSAGASERGQAVIDKSLAYLKSQQQADGGWQLAPAQPPAITALVLRAFVLDPKYKSDADFIKKGYDKLLSYQLENGGIYKDLLANYNTAISISALAAADNPAFKPRIDGAVAYLKSLQWNDRIDGGPKGEKNIDIGNPWFGGSGYGSKGRPDGSNSQFLVDALYDTGVKANDPAMQAALKFFTRMQNLSETNDQPWAGNDGGAIYTPANGGASEVGEYKGPDGKRMLRSYGSMTYAMLKTYVYAGLTKDDPRVKAAWDWISKNWSMTENPGARLSDPPMPNYAIFYYYMTLARALNAYDQPIITDAQGNQHDWRVELIDQLAKLQKPDGSFLGEKKEMEDNPILVTAYSVLALEEALKDLKEHPAK